jgi:hypothetical protein
MEYKCGLKFCTCTHVQSLVGQAVESCRQAANPTNPVAPIARVVGILLLRPLTVWHLERRLRHWLYVLPDGAANDACHPALLHVQLGFLALLAAVRVHQARICADPQQMLSSTKSCTSDGRASLCLMHKLGE